MIPTVLLYLTYESNFDPYGELLNSEGFHIVLHPSGSSHHYINSRKTLQVRVSSSQTKSQEDGAQVFEDVKKHFAGFFHKSNATPSGTPIGLDGHISMFRLKEQYYVWGNYSFIQLRSRPMNVKVDGALIPINAPEDYPGLMESTVRYAIAHQEAKFLNATTQNNLPTIQDAQGNTHVLVDKWAGLNGATVHFEKRTALLTVSKPGKTLKVRLASPRYTFNGQTKETTTFPVLKYGKVWLPQTMLTSLD